MMITEKINGLNRIKEGLNKIRVRIIFHEELID